MSQSRPRTVNTQGISWLLHRLSATFLIVALFGHLLQQHVLNHAYEIELADSAVRMADVGYFAFIVVFLLAASFHGLNGVYQATIGEGMSGRRKQVIRWSLTLIGVVIVVQGMRLALAMGGYI